LAVKILRICLLVWLAVLLPIRGVVAATMLCPPSDAMPHGAAMSAADHHAHHASMQTMPGDASATHDHPHAAPAAHEANGPDQCSLCCDFCSATPMPGGHVPSLAPSLDAARVTFPHLSAPAPSFVSDGQERPPRSS
jgi:hypothetical protein